MSRGLAHSIVRKLLGASLASVLLAACGTTTVIGPRVVGVPSISISVPLETVACTTSNSCVAIGASNATVGPLSVGQYRRPSGRWSPVAVPWVPSSSIAMASCWHTQCLLGGSSPNGDLLWRYDATTHSVASLAAPTGGSDVRALSCYAALSCALIDAGVMGSPRFAITADGGTTWTTPTPVAPANRGTVTGVACAVEFHCIISFQTPAHQTNLYVTSDGGTTWTSLATPSSWTAFSSISCRGVHCVAIVMTPNGSRFVRSSTFATHWSGVALSGTALALACTTRSHCVIVGNNGPGAPWLAIVHNSAVRSATLQYVPTPLLSVSCGRTICSAVGVTTVVALSP
jgi:hypothetical protein